MKKILAVLVVIVVFVVGLFAWQSSRKEDKSASDITIVTSFYPVYEFTKAIVGDEAEVNLLIGAGTEVHDYEPTTKEIANISDADAFVYMDDSMETWIESLEKSVDTDKVTLIKATGDMLLMAGHEEDEEEGHEGHSHEYDPHVWLSPSRSINLVENIRKDLVAKFPELEETFTKNAAAYREKLRALDGEYKEAFSNAKQKSFVTQHAAFAYLALDYGLDQISITGVSAEAEPTAKRLASLTEYVKEYAIKYIYFEENASSAVAKTLAKEAGVETAVLNPLESLTQQQLKDGEDYFSVMRANLAALRLTTDLEGKEIKAEAETEKSVSDGYFDDADVTDRNLSNWTGKWQSVYPYLLDGSLNQVWDYKAKASQGEKTAAEYKEYYTKGYQTDVQDITIDGDKMTMEFVKDGTSYKYTYDYAGYKILSYEKGNRGVRYLFTATDDKAGEFQYVQFSDHAISNQDAEHFHLFWGATSHEEILKEMENWPTYYSAELSGQEIAQEIVAH